MARISDVTARIRANNEMKRGLKDASRSVDGFKTRTTKAFRGLLGPIAAFTGIAGIGLISKKMFEVGSSALETRSKLEAVFGDSIVQVDAFNEEFSKLAGISRTNLEAVISTTGAIAQGLGFTGEAATSLAIEVTKLGGDFASFNNLPTEETVRAIQSALTGERESLKRLGIVIKQTDVDQLALIQTGKTATSQLNDQDRATATLTLITKKAGVAVGDLARTQNSAANQARRVKAAFQDIGTTISLAVIPAFAALLPLLLNVADFIAETLPKIGETISFLADMAGLIDTSTTAVQRSIETVKSLDLLLRDQVRTRDQLSVSVERLGELEKSQEGLGFFERRTDAAKETRREIEGLRDTVIELTTREELLGQAVAKRQATQESAAAATVTAAEAGRFAPPTLPPGAIGPRGVVPIGAGELEARVPGLPTQLPTPEALTRTTSALVELRSAFFDALEPVERFVDASLTLEDTFGRLAGETLLNLAAAFNDAFAAIGAGDNVFKSIGKAVKQSVAESAAAEGRLEFARGAAKIALGIFPPNPAAIASGLKHFAAGAAFSAIGGALGGGAGRGGAGAGGGFTGRNELRPTDDPFARPRGRVIINLPATGILDMTNPIIFKAVTDAVNEGIDRDAIIFSRP
ncbi:hypothetical protein LCGC14_0718180 [marine sediment metagenome]|uniref:Uncharacterized protein n=1 Tax=marine sediment metagenome TaxID=412755 RepID=A0A0F9SYK0_9ZZZZ